MKLPPDILIPVVTELMESMYFMLPEYCGERALPGPVAQVGVRFSGPQNGCFHVSVTDALAARMAADFLAMDLSTVDRQQLEATVAELANVACGAALAAWQPQVDFQFSLPFILPTDSDTSSDCAFSVTSDEPEISFGVTVADDASGNQRWHA